MDLPFLEKSHWPTSKESKEQIVSDQSHEESISESEIQEHLIQELLQAFEQKDATAIKDCLISLIQSINDEGMGNEND